MRTHLFIRADLDDRAHQITELRDDTVELLPTGMSYPIYRAERQEQFEQLLRADNRNDFYTEFLPANPDAVDQDLRDVLAHGLIGEADKAELSQLLHNGKSNREVALWLSRAYPNIVETMELETGDTADYRTMPEGIELEVLDAEEKRLAMLFFRWDEVAPLLRGLYARQLDGFGQERPEPAAETPAYHAETVAVYPGDKNHLPYDVVVQTLRTDEPEPPAPAIEPEKTLDEVLDEHPISIQVNGEWQTFPNARAAEEAAYGEYKENLRRTAENFRITDDHLGEGGPKAKFQANIEAIKLLKYLEGTTGQATPEQQQVLSRYVGWGGLADPDMYKTDTFLEVTDEVQAVFLSDKRAEAAHERQMYRYKAQYSLDCDNGIEDAVVHRSPTPEEVLEDKQLRDQIFTAVMELPDKQAKRIYARFYLDMSVKEIAQVEGVDPRRVRDSIHLGLKKLEKVFSQASE